MIGSSVNLISTLDGMGLVDTINDLSVVRIRPTGPLEGKEVHVGRVALHECQNCGHLMPTPAGQAKVNRNVSLSIRLFLGQLR